MRCLSKYLVLNLGFWDPGYLLRYRGTWVEAARDDDALPEGDARVRACMAWNPGARQMAAQARTTNSCVCVSACLHTHKAPGRLSEEV